MKLYKVTLGCHIYLNAEDAGHAKDIVADLVDDIIEVGRLEKVIVKFNRATEVVHDDA